MKNNSKQTAQTIALIINGIKNSINDFSLEELTNLLKQNKCPYWNRITTILLSHNLLVKDGKNKYNFINNCPIYYIHFETELIKILKRQNKYSKKWYDKKVVNNDIITIELTEVEKAIQLLKENGYKIFKEI